MKHLIRVEVTWNDAHGNALGEFAQHEIPHAAYPWTTIGYLLRDDDAGISLAAEVGTTNNYRGVTFVPKGMILKVRYLNKPKKVTRQASDTSSNVTGHVSPPSTE